MRTLLAGLVLLLAAGTLAASEADGLYRKARAAERKGEFAQAYILYSEAAALAPDKQEYWLRAQAVQSRAALQAKPTPPPVAPEDQAPAEPDVIVPPEKYYESITAREMAEARRPLPPAHLAGAIGRKDFDIRGDAKQVFEQVAKAFELDCVFDSDYQPASAFRFQMREANYREALRALEAVTSSFVVPLSDRLFMVVKDTPQKRKEVEPSVTITIPVPEPTSPQDLTALITAVQQSLAIEKIAWDTQKNMVVMRDRISKIRPARRIFEDLLHPRAQVAIEVNFIEVGRQKLLSYGFALPNVFNIYNLTNFLHNPLPTGTGPLATFGGGASLFGVAIANAQLFANMTDSNIRTLLQAEVRSVENQPATLHVGNRYPILTAGYFGPQSFSTGGQVYTPPPSFTFEDLGLTVKATPQVHGMDDISLDLEAEFKLLGGTAINGIPIISNRQLKSKVRLKDGEWAVVAGMMSDTEARTISGIAGISNLPAIGSLLRRNDKENDKEEVLIVIRPRLITPPPEESVTGTIWVGPDQRPVSPL